MDKVYIVNRGTEQTVYGNIKIMCEKEGLNYMKVYRSLRRHKGYFESNRLFINELEIIKSKR